MGRAAHALLAGAVSGWSHVAKMQAFCYSSSKA
jgi:hypothetical protein